MSQKHVRVFLSIRKSLQEQVYNWNAEGRAAGSGELNRVSKQFNWALLVN